MKTNLKKLIAYSSSATAFLSITDANSQVIYHDIDPDMVLNEVFPGGDASYYLDFNDDGITDIQINGHLDFEAYVVGELITFSYAIFTASIIQNYQVIKNPSYPSSYGADNLASGFSINSSDLWNDQDTIKLIYFNQYYGSMPYDNWLSENQYLGVKFKIGAETHFGWVRLSISNYNNDNGIPEITIQDYAYESTPVTPITIENPTAASAENLVITDETDLENAGDFKIKFNQAEDETTISAYRVFLYKYIWYDPPPSVELLESLPAERYLEIAPSGLFTYESNFPASMTDINGDLISIGYPYYYAAIILSVADGVIATQNNISVRSNLIISELTEVPGPISLTIDFTDDNCNISDFTVSFHKANDESHISEYRVFILNDDHNSVSVVDPVFYQSVYPDGSDEYFVDIDAGKLIYEDTLPILFQNYYTEIMTIGDSIYTTIANFNSTRYDETYYGGTEGIEVEYYCPHYDHTPVITFVDTTKTSADIRLQFSGPEKTSNLKEYRVFIIPEEDVSGFTISDAESVPLSNYFKITGANNFIDINLPPELSDINGNSLMIDKRYSIIIGLVDKSAHAKISISNPSEIFSFLSDEGNLPLPYTYIFEDILYVISDNPNAFTLNIYNMAGEVVLSYEISTAITLIDLHEYSNGIYIIKSNPPEDMLVTKIFTGQ